MKIGVFRALQLGDLVCSVPALRALRAGNPHARISLIGLLWSQEFVDRFSHYVDEFIWFPGLPKLPEQPYDPKRTREFIKNIQQKEFDLLIQMQGNGTIVNSFLKKLGAKKLAGFYPPGSACPDFHNFLEYPEHGSEIHRHLKLMSFLGFPSKGDDLEFPLRQKDYDDFHQLKLPLRPFEYVVIHPGAREAKRRWSLKKFQQIASFCHQLGYQIVLTGTASEKDITEAITKQCSTPMINTAGQTTLGDLAVLLNQSKFVITNDTGISHVVAGLKKHSIVISLAPEGERWLPLNRDLHHIIDGHSDRTVFQVKQQILHLASLHYSYKLHNSS